MGPVHDVPAERLAETGEMDAPPGNEQTLRNYTRRLREGGGVGEGPDARRRHDVADVPEPGRMAQVDFGQQDCGGGLVAHLMCVPPWHSRLLGACARDHRLNPEGSRRALHRLGCKRGGRVRAYAIGQDGAFVSEEACGEAFGTATLKASLEGRGITPWVCRKAGPGSKGAVGSGVRSVRGSLLSARELGATGDAQGAPPAWAERESRRTRQGAYQVPQQALGRVERAALGPPPSPWEAAPADLVEAPVNGQPCVPRRSVRHSVPWDMCHTTAHRRVVGGEPRICDARRRHACAHGICEAEGSSARLDERRGQPASDWLDTAGRLRLRWSCTGPRHLTNGFRRGSPGRRLGGRLAAVERYLGGRRPSGALAAEVMAACRRGCRCRLTQSKAVLDPMEARATDVAAVATDVLPAADADARCPEPCRRALKERGAS